MFSRENDGTPHFLLMFFFFLTSIPFCKLCFGVSFIFRLYYCGRVAGKIFCILAVIDLFILWLLEWLFPRKVCLKQFTSSIHVYCGKGIVIFWLVLENLLVLAFLDLVLSVVSGKNAKDRQTDTPLPLSHETVDVKALACPSPLARTFCSHFSRDPNCSRLSFLAA